MPNTDLESLKRKIDALKRLAEDQKGKPEGISALKKAQELLAKYPDVAKYAREQFSGSDWDYIIAHDIGIGKRYYGDTIQEAMEAMKADFAQDLSQAQKPASFGGLLED